jgi:predicted RNase H-like HicB family nuclease
MRDSLEEVRELIREKIAFHIAGLREVGLSVPKPSAKAGELIELSAA